MDIQDVKWPGWEVTRLIGNGSFGSVYEIQRDLYGNVEKAALKVISIPQNKGDIEELYNDGYDDASITARFNGYLEDIVREYSMMANMKGHTNIVYCDDLKQIQHEDGLGWDIYIKMELLTPLTKVLGKEITEEQATNLGIDICNALTLCKDRNIVHRDIKPQNIFVSQDGNYKLGDFGIAKTAERTTSGTKVGTYKYMAPEVYKSEPYGSSADIYSLGLVMYWMLNERRTPFLPLPPATPGISTEDEARKRRFTGEQIPAPAHGSKELQAIVLKACAYDSKDRFASAADMMAALKALKTGDKAAVAALLAGCVNKENLTEETTTKEEKTQTDTVGEIHSKEPDTAQEMTAGTVGVFGTIDSDKGTDEQDGTVGMFGAANSKKQTNGTEKAENADLRSGDEQERTINAFSAQVRKAEQPEEEKNKKKKGLLIFAIIAACAILAVGIGSILAGKGSGKEEENLAAPTDRLDISKESTAAETETKETEKEQVHGVWSEWMDELPDGISEDENVIETRTLYSSRTKETTTSSSPSKDGWTRDGSTSTNAGAWSDWSQTKASASSTLEVETQTRYRYRTRETCTGSSPTLSGWTCYEASDSFGPWSSWSDWGTGYNKGNNDTTKTESKKQYRYRTYMSDSYGNFYNYSSWSSWADSYPSGTHQEVETRTVYRYCTRNVVTEYHFERWSAWSSWSTTSVSENANRQVEKTTFYRSRKATSITYCFYRWSEWSKWSETEINSNSNTEVRTKTQYRYAEK